MSRTTYAFFAAVMFVAIVRFAVAAPAASSTDTTKAPAAANTAATIPPPAASTAPDTVSEEAAMTTTTGVTQNTAVKDVPVDTGTYGVRLRDLE